MTPLRETRCSLSESITICRLKINTFLQRRAAETLYWIVFQYFVCTRGPLVVAVVFMVFTRRWRLIFKLPPGTRLTAFISVMY